MAVAWEAPGLTIVAAAQAQNETDYHAHFIVDNAYEVVAGAPVPQQCGVLHTAANPATLTNLAPGEHTVALVIANPGHIPVEGLDRPAVTFTVAEDPDAVRITSPENCAEVAGPEVEIAWEAPGLTIVPAKEAKTETDLHAHFIVDNAYEVVEDAPIPMQDGVIHTAANPVTIGGLAPGLHTIQLVIANPGHVPVADLARPKLTIVVSDEGMATPAAEAAAQSADAATIVMRDIFFEPVAGDHPGRYRRHAHAGERGRHPAQLLDRRPRRQRRRGRGSIERGGHRRSGRDVRVLLQCPRAQSGRDGRHADRGVAAAFRGP